MVHSSNAPLTDAAVMRAFRLYTAAFGAFVDDLTLPKSEAFDIFVGRVSFRNCPLKAQEEESRRWKKGLVTTKECTGSVSMARRWLANASTNRAWKMIPLIV